MDRSVIWESDVRELLADCIFTYGKLKYTKNTIDDETLPFSSLRSFNDIYECDYRITHYFHSIEDEKKLLHGPVSPFSHIEDKIAAHLAAIRVCCFSHSAYNNLMWSHYANDHKGVCYCFEKPTRKSPLFEGEEMSWGEVQYSSQVPELILFQDKTTEGMLRALIQPVILTKASDWSYEQEFRIFDRLDVPARKFLPEKLRAVILGRRVSDAKVETVRNRVADYNDRNQTDVRVLFAHRVASSYVVGVHTNIGMREGGFSAQIPVLPDIDSPPLTTVPKEG